MTSSKTGRSGESGDKGQAQDTAFVEALAKIARENNLAEIEVSRHWGKDSQLNVRVCAQSAARAPAAIAPPAPAPVAQPASVPAETEAPAADEPASGTKGLVTAPMIGTVYMQPDPEAPQFVEIGQKVEKGETLLIIEAMKTMNPIPAPHGGTVKRIMVENTSIVEFGSPLMIIG